MGEGQNDIQRVSGTEFSFYLKNQTAGDKLRQGRLSLRNPDPGSNNPRNLPGAHTTR